MGIAMADHGPPVASPNRPPPTHDVIIVGAGIAGISAAATLHAQGQTSFVVLEASRRVGGRIHSVEFGDPSVARLRVELGAHWISGAHTDRPGAANNPLIMAARADEGDAFRMVRVPGGSTNLSNCRQHVFERVNTQPYHAHADMLPYVRQGSSTTRRVDSLTVTATWLRAGGRFKRA